MKKLLYILFLLAGFVAKSQVVVPRSPITVAPQDARLYTTFNLKIPVYADTTTANTYIGHDSTGLIIYNRADSNVYIRDLGLGHHRWKVVGPGGAGNVIDVFGRAGHVIALTGDYAAFYPVLSGSYADPSWIASLSASKISGTQTVSAGSSKVILGGTPTGAAFQPFSIDIVPANISLATLGGLLGIAQINATGAASSSTFLRGDGTWSSPGSTVTGLPNSWVGAGYRLTFNFTNNVRTLFSRGYLVLDSTTNSNGITFYPDTSAGKLATKTDLLTPPFLTSTRLAFGNGSNQMTDNSSLTWDNTNKILKSSTANLNFNNGSIVINDSADASLTADNVIIGFGALNNSVTSIGRNVAIGTRAMQKSTSICCNVAVGYQALQNSVTGSNTAVGYQTLTAATTGAGNTAIGSASLAGLTTGSNNLDIGGGGLNAITTGSHNTYIGVPNTSQISGASFDNIIIGYQVTGGTVTRNNVTMIGDSLSVPANNTFLLGRKNQAIIIGEAGGNTALMISIPQTTGALFYNSDSAAYCYYNGSNWVSWGGGGGGGGGSSPPFSDANPLVKNGVDGSKQIVIDASALTTATTRTYTGPDVNGTLVLNANTATLTNKTIAAGSNTITGLTNTNLSGSAQITNANLNTMANNTVKGNVSGGTAVPSDLTATQVTAMLNVFTSSLKGLAPSSTGGTTNFLRADGTWAAPPGAGSDSALVPQFGLAETKVGSAKFWRVDTAALYAAKISYFVNGLGLGLTNQDSVYLGGSPLIRDTHLSGSNSFFLSFDSMKLYYRPVASTIQNLDTTNRKVLTWNPTTKQIDVTYWQVPGAGSVSSVSGTANRITSTGGTTPTIDISATFEALLGKVANPLSQFASTTSSQLRGIISDETGTGVAVFATSPLFVTPRLASTSTTGYVWTATDNVGNGSWQASTGGGSSFTRQSITSGSSGTVTGGNYIVTFDPSSVISTYALTLPASPSDMDEVEIEAGGTITGGAGVVTALTISPNSGQTIHQANIPTSINDGETIKYRYRSSNTAWYRKL